MAFGIGIEDGKRMIEDGGWWHQFLGIRDNVAHQC